MKKKFSLLFLILLSVSCNLFSQYYETGQDPASLKWKQIKTEHFNIIFPVSFTGMAGHYATLLEGSYSNALTLYPGAKAKIPVIIHNYSMESNGYVVWAPKRMELFPLPGQDNLPVDPARILTMHEVTHVMQMASLNKGFTRVMSAILGEQSTGISSAMLPLWALEGDAVFSETRFTNSGRGRNNAFMQGAKAISMGIEGNFGYNKMLFGSYRDFTPDHYVFGYAMMNHLRSTSPDAWKDAIAFTARNPFLINPVNLSLRHNARLTKKELYKTTFGTLADTWTKENRSAPGCDYPALNHDKKRNYENYLSPFKTGNGKYVALKTSFSEPPHFVLIDTETGREKKLLTTGYLSPAVFSYANGIIAWAEFQSDPRWENRNFSIIKTIDLNDGTVRRLTNKSRFSAPSLSSDGSLIAAVETSPEMVTSLVIIDRLTGSVKNEIPAPGGIMLQRPGWGNEDKSIAVVSLSPEGEGIMVYDLKANIWNVVIENSPMDFSMVQVRDSLLYLLVQDEKSDNIYFKKPGEPLKRITNSVFGISSFSLSGDTVLFSDYSSSGFNICQLSINASNDSIHFPLYKDIIPLPNILPESNLTDNGYKISDYRKTGYLFNFHSWAPLYFDVDELQSETGSIGPGFTLMSQNNLSTLISTFAYEYSNGLNILHSSLKWQGWYPVIELEMSHGRENFFTNPSDISYFSSDIKHISSIDLNIYLPLYYTYGKFNVLFMPAIYLSHINNYFYPFESYGYKDNLTILTPRIYISNTFRKAIRDIYPRWGQIIDLKTEFTPLEPERFRTLKGVKSTFFFPGFFRNNSIMVKAGYENQFPLKKGLFANINSLPRGYDGMVYAELSVVSGDYTHAIFYPDLSAGSLLYLKRIRGSEFVDYASGYGIYNRSTGKYSETQSNFGSYGAELLADFYLLRIPYEISAGVRAGNKFPDREFFVEGVFSVNIYGTTLGRKR